MLLYKIFAIAFLIVFVMLQVILIRADFSGTRTIEIKMKRNHDSSVYPKDLRPENMPVDQFVVKVTPVGFWDKLLLTNSKGNLLCVFFKITTIMAFTWYVFNLSYSNFFSVRSFNILWLTVAFAGCILLAHSLGLNHTRDFWNNLYTLKNGGNAGRLDMYVDTRYNFHYYAIPVIFALCLYRYFIGQHIRVVNNLAEAG